MGPVLVLATIQVATAIITEATLSFLGVGVPPTSPSLGTLIRVGNDYLFSGEWWITIFPGVMLVTDCPVGQPAGRLAARRAEPEAALSEPC
jgi:peptide/nickel transport system permease protein